MARKAVANCDDYCVSRSSVLGDANSIFSCRWMRKAHRKMEQHHGKRDKDTSEGGKPCVTNEGPSGSSVESAAAMQPL